MVSKAELKRQLAQIMDDIQPQVQVITVTFSMPEWTVSDEAEELGVWEQLISLSSRGWRVAESCDHPWGPYIEIELIATDNGYNNTDKRIARIQHIITEFLAEKYNAIADLKRERQKQVEAGIEHRSLERYE